MCRGIIRGEAEGEAEALAQALEGDEELWSHARRDWIRGARFVTTYLNSSRHMKELWNDAIRGKRPLMLSHYRLCIGDGVVVS